MSEAKPSAWARKKARRALVQAIYQWQMTRAGVRQIEAEFDDALKKADREYFREALEHVALRSDSLDGLLSPLLDRSVDALDKVELAVLRLGAYELSERLDIPYRVVIDEGVELAKTFGAEDGHKYINGVLDRLARDLRALERPAAGPGLDTP